MARSVSFSMTLAEVTPYWEPALWALIVVVTVGIVGSALWAPSRSGHRRGRRKLFRRSDARARRDERTAAAATMVPAANAVAKPSAASAVSTTPAPILFDQADGGAAVPTPAAPTTEETATVEPVASEPVTGEQSPAAPAAVEPVPEYAPPPAPLPIANGVSTQERPPEPAADPVRAVPAVALADCEGGFVRLASDVASLKAQVTFFDERSNVPAEMPTWPIEHQQALAERAAEALADPLDELLEHSLAVASDVRALDRILGGRAHDEDAAQAIVATRIDLDGLRRHLGRIHHRFLALARDFDVLAGTADQLAKVASIVDATDAVMGSWAPTLVEAERVASARH